jgi:selenocysteine lyase/cysteine desulfurase
VDALRREGIVTSSRDSNVRISAHCYNAAEDVDAVLESLARHRRLLVRA